jgi:hypothetical protein
VKECAEEAVENALATAEDNGFVQLLDDKEVSLHCRAVEAEKIIE